MEPSLIHLDTPDEVQLAYAQAASAIEFILVTRGHPKLREVMDRMADSATRGAGEPIRETLGLEFSEFEAQWRQFLASKELKPARGLMVQRLKVKEGRADEERLDMEGDQIHGRPESNPLGRPFEGTGRIGAAVLEYRRALEETQDAVPIMTRLASAWLSWPVMKKPSRS